MAQFGCLFQALYSGLVGWLLWGSLHPLLVLPLAVLGGMTGAWLTVVGLGLLVDTVRRPPP